MLGVRGVEYMVSEGSPQPFQVLLRSAVVRAGHRRGVGGSRNWTSTAVTRLLGRREIGYLSEVMNFPGVLANRAPDVMAKIAAAVRSCGKTR